MRKVLLTLLLACITITSFSQTEERILLSEYIQAIEKEHGIVFSYNPELIEKIKIAPTSGNNIDEIIKQLNATSAFNFELINNDNVVVSSKKDNNNLLIEGSVFVSKNDPLFGAYVKIPSQKAYTTTKSDGSFKLLGQYNPTDSLEISFIGYKTQKISLIDVNEGSIKNFHIEASSQLMNEFSVIAYTTSGVIYNKKDQSIELTPDNAGLLPGETETDIYNSLQYLPGVNSPTGKAGQLTMRGADPDKTLITIDDIPIYHLGHYSGTFSPFNAQLIENVKIQRNGSHGAERGGRVGGLVEIKTKSNILDTAKYNVGAATSYLSANAQIPIIKDKLGILIGGRVSHPADWNSPKINSINDFIYQESTVGAAFSGNKDFDLKSYNYSFYDFNFKTVYKLHKNHQVSLSFMNIHNELDYNNVFIPRNLDVEDSVSLENWGVNLSIQNQWSNKISSITSITKSSYRQNLSSTQRDTTDDVTSSTSYSNQTNDLKIKSILNFAMKNKKSIDIGYQMDFYDLHYTYTDYTAAVAATPGAPPPGPPPSPGSPAVYDEINIPTDSYLHTTFINYNISNFDKPLTVIAGIRASYFTNTKKIYPEPRLLVNYRLSESITLKSNVGLYNQFVNHITGARVSPIGGIDAPFWQLSNNNGIMVVTGKQAMLGSIFNKNNFVFDVEGYYKIIDNATAYNFIDDDLDKPFVYGQYDNYGVDVLLKKSYKNLDAWMSYSYSQSDAKFDTIQFEYLWNQSHVFSTVMSYKWKKFKFSAGWHYKTGLAVGQRIRGPYLIGAPIFNINNANNLTNNTTRTYTDDSPEEYTDRFPDSHQLDLSVAYSIIPQEKKWKLTIGGGIQNVYNNTSIYFQGFRPAGPNYPNGYVIRTHKTTLGFTPSLMLNFSW